MTSRSSGDNWAISSVTSFLARWKSSLAGAGGVAGQGAVSRRCWCGDTGLIASASSDSRRLRQTPWYCRNVDPNQSKFNRCNLSHIIFPLSHVVLRWSDVSCIRQNIRLEQSGAIAHAENFSLLRPR